MKAHLKANGMGMKQGTSIGATLIAASSFTMNKQRERYPEMHQTREGKQWDYRCAEGFAHGMNVHIGVDGENRLINSVKTTPVNVHGHMPATELLHGAETVVYAVVGYLGIEKCSEMHGRGIGFRVAMCACKRRTYQIHLRGEWAI